MNTMDHRIAERRQEVTEERARGRLRWLIWLVLRNPRQIPRLVVGLGTILFGLLRRKRSKDSR